MTPTPDPTSGNPVVTPGHRIEGVAREHDPHVWYRPEPGGYWRDGVDGDWWGCTPNGLVATFSAHTVVEHADGTITVSPSIQGEGNSVTSGGHAEWHGYLLQGIWREV